MKNRATRFAGLLLLVSFFLPSELALADSPYEAGVKLYGQRNYRAAALEFEKAMAAAPRNVDAIYYCALCQQLSNNRTRAKQLFEYILSNYGSSRVADSARQALNQLGAGSTTHDSGSSSQTSSAASSYNSVPDEVRVPFEKRGNDVIVQVGVNGRPVSFILDTGASSVVVGQNQLQEWGIHKAEGKEKFDSLGVGEEKARAWNQSLDLKLGQIYMRDFPVKVQDNLPTMPLLGQTFLKNFNVSIEDASKTVVLAKKGSGAARRVGQRTVGAKEIPFHRGSGGHILVNVTVNRKPFEMIFDTGAELCSFTTSDWKKLGMEVPEGARRGVMKGVQGDVPFSFCTCDLALGPISKQDFEVGIIDTARTVPPLLGMSFYGSMKYNIDTTRNVIIFTESE